MKYRKLANTDLEVSRVCMGCWQISTDRSDYWGSQQVQDSIQAIKACIEVGINFFDSAEDYDEGGSEQVLGKALGNARSDVVIATKANPAHLRPDSLRQACEDSLRRLGTDWIDLYQVHFPNPDVPSDDVIAGMLKLQQAGKIRHFGVCNYGASYLRSLSSTSGLTSNQLPYSLLWRVIENEILPLSLERSMDILAYSPLFQGLLTGKYGSVQDVPAGRRQTRIFSSSQPQAQHGEPGFENLAFQTIGVIRQIAQSADVSMSDLAMAWVLARPGVCSVIAGARNVEQVQQNAASSEIELSDEVITQINEATDPLKQAIGTNADMWQHESRLERPGVPTK